MKLSEFTRLLQKVVAEQDYELKTTSFHIDRYGEIIVTGKKLVVYPTESSIPRLEYE